ncbi:MAG: prepilin peptidase [Lachnospiraceae bacterium]|nr:prepilin peptidase [Lachnospiraceae bacterium]
MWELIFLLVCSVWDLRTKRIPIWLLGVGAVGTFLFLLSCNKVDLCSVLGGIGIGGICLVISKVTGEALGYGDSLLICLLGSYAGFINALWTVTVAFGLAGIFSLIFFMGKGGYKRRTIPFIPFLTISYIGVMYI